MLVFRNSERNRNLLKKCCYLGMFVQAMVINLTPLIFIPLREQFGLSFEQVGRLVLVNFLTQLVVDLICCAFADRVNAKPLLVFANLAAFAGLWVFALGDRFFAEPYHGLLLGTVIFSIGCGLLEVLLSPIVNAISSDKKSSDMAMLHAFYPVGKIAVIIVTAVALLVFGTKGWPWIMLAWSVVPLLNTLGFSMVAIPPFAEEGRRQRLRDLFFSPIYRWILVTMFLAGATEVTLAQWASAYVQAGLGYSKAVADLLGFCVFGVGMLAGRLWFGLYGEKLDLRNVLLAGGIFSTIVYIVMALAPVPWIALLACGLAGLFVSMLWPGTLSVSAAAFPLAGASMFALLAAAGDAGAGIMPWAMGLVADEVSRSGGWFFAIFGHDLSPEQLGLRAGLLVAALCPFFLILTVHLSTRKVPPEASPWRDGIS